MKKGDGITYKSAGVDIDAGNKAVDLIKERVKGTFSLLRTGKVITDLGGFSSVVELPNGKLVVTTTDGVGTKLIVGILMNKHDTVGIDLGAMCFNDLLAGGILPAIFLDYIALGKQIPEKTSEIMEGIIVGCEQAGAALVGGEMAECPGLYGPEEYDLAGFAVGFADSRKELILGDKIEPGMKIYGLPSSGLHSNSYSLARKVFGINLNTPVASISALDAHNEVLGCTLGEELLRPTKIYVQEVERLMGKYDIAGMINVTGGGLVENPPRVLPRNCSAIINLETWKPQPIFGLLQKLGNVSREEMLKVTNYGIGFMLISADEIADDGVIEIGNVVEGAERKVIFA